MRKHCVAALALAGATLGAQAQNLLANPGNELPLVNGEITGWTEVLGTHWTQRSADPAPHGGSHYFFAGVAADATLRQTVDVSAWAGSIDAGTLDFALSAWLRSWPQSPPDSSTVRITLLDTASAPLASYTSPTLADPARWTEVSSTLHAPVGTRQVRIDLMAHRNAGNNNDGYFDDVSLLAVPVPEPAAAALWGAGLLALLLAGRRRRPGSPSGRQRPPG